MFKLNSHFWLFTLAICVFTVGGCSTKHVSLDSEEHTQMLRADQEQIQQMAPLNDASHYAAYSPEAYGVLELSLHDAMERGVLYNLDARVAAVEILAEHSDVSVELLKALPSINASGSYQGRSNAGASSSQSVLSGTQSLEPSQSTEENRRTAELSLSWNIIDAALAVSEAQNAKEEVSISQARYRKVLQNIQRDVYTAYARTAVFQNNIAPIRNAMKDTQAQIENITSAKSQKLISSDEASDRIMGLAKLQQDLATQIEDMSQAEIELKSLISLPLAREVALIDGIGEHDAGTFSFQKYDDLIAQNIESLEWDAIQNRPEMREEVLKKNLAWRNTRQELIKTVPGLELFLAGNFDDNRFFQDQNWANYSAKIMQSLTALLTAPARYRDAQNNETIADVRRRALMLAIMAQTRISRQNMIFARAHYHRMKREEGIVQAQLYSATQKHETGFLSGEDVLNVSLRLRLAKLATQRAKVQMQSAYATFLNTLGRDVLPEIKVSQLRTGGGG